jgi:retrograde regulation protein 2
MSLYDAQFRPGSDTRQPIPKDIQKRVISRLLRFKETCRDFEVSESKITVLATEATRLAPNSTEFRETIKRATGWDVRMLSKEDEGTIGALGVASSLANVEGVVMDLGGGSTQITWLSSRDGVVRTRPEGSISFPYGAAALTRRLEEAKRSGEQAVKELEIEMFENFQRASADLGVAEEVLQRARQQGGLSLYLSGGGFRGWGYLLMNQTRVNPYPIPIINGFKVETRDFQDTASVTNALSAADTKVFRISERRASQVPAVAFLISVLTRALPLIKTVHFCQGGVREGFIFQSLPPEIRVQDPLVVATMPFRTRSSLELSSLLKSSLPDRAGSEGENQPHPGFTQDFITAFSNLMYAHSDVVKDVRPAAALHSTTTGLLCSAHGLSHEDRALLALALYERWSGDLSPSDQQLLAQLRRVISPEQAWWCMYLGRVAALVGDLYPAGVIREETAVAKISFEVSLQSEVRPKKGGLKRTLGLVVRVLGGVAEQQQWDLEIIREAAEQIEKLGKKKNWIKVQGVGEDAEWGLKVAVTVKSIS